MSDNEQENENSETVAEILEEMRGMGNYQRYSGDHVRALANRINAAYNRALAKVEADALTVGGIVEAARTAEKSSAVGNAAAMREALVRLRDIALAALEKRSEGVDTVNLAEAILHHSEKALAAPPRQCDVGTAEEQAYRMRLYCKSNGVDESGCFRCEKCPFLTSDKCELAWAQMPYEEQEGAGNERR